MGDGEWGKGMCVIGTEWDGVVADVVAGATNWPYRPWKLGIPVGIVLKAVRRVAAFTHLPDA